MSFSAEGQHSGSDSEPTDGWLLRTDLDEIFFKYAEHFVTIQDGNEPGSPTEILLGGQVEGDRPGTFLDISLVFLIVGEELSTATVSVGQEHYEITDQGVRDASNPLSEVDDDDFEELRDQLSVDNDSWDIRHSKRIGKQLRDFENISA